MGRRLRGNPLQPLSACSAKAKAAAEARAAGAAAPQVVEKVVEKIVTVGDSEAVAQLQDAHKREIAELRKKGVV
mgnify:CR=1 FL=1